MLAEERPLDQPLLPASEPVEFHFQPQPKIAAPLLLAGRFDERKTPRRKKEGKSGPKYKRHTEAVNEAVIRQYYGTLSPTEDQISNPRISVPALAKRMRMACTTIYNIVRRFVYRGFII